ncbi:MAG: DUF6089 family protein [Cytophagales bacterium]|nr:DUF6089 family protein [Cytophagales bacterium]
MKRLIALIFILLAVEGVSQSFFNWQYNDRYFSLIAGSGMTAYFGELNDNNRIRQEFSNFSIGLEARLLSRVAARAEVIYYSLEGDDLYAEDSSFNRQRNLSFFSRNVEANLQGIFFLRKYRGDYHKRWAFDPYMGLGVGVTTYSPTAELDSVTYKLRELETEGVEYGQFALVLPLTFGVKMRFNEFVNFNMELGYRYAFTDYLDDVSTVFIESDGSIAGRLSNRKDEVRTRDNEFFIVNQEHYDAQVAGAPRGNPDRNDSYLYISFRLEVFLPRKNTGPLFKKPSAY